MALSLQDLMFRECILPSVATFPQQNCIHFFGFCNTLLSTLPSLKPQMQTKVQITMSGLFKQVRTLHSLHLAFPAMVLSWLLGLESN